ncbi:VOC family protein [Patescibacteria group bacterium]|nr:VOC family protein [Patescibacteria group bacterium]
MPNRVGHFEIHADNPERCGKFYSDVFGWQIEKWEGGQMEYWMVMTGPREEAGGINGGIMRRPCPAPAPSGTATAYVCTIVVDHYDEMAEKILAAGGKVAMPKFALKGMAWQGYFIDTEGNAFGLHQADTNAA